jgi:hypothetical protein
MSRVSCEALKSVRNAQKKTSFNLWWLLCLPTTWLH